VISFNVLLFKLRNAIAFQIETTIYSLWIISIVKVINKNTFD